MYYEVFDEEELLDIFNYEGNTSIRVVYDAEKLPSFENAPHIEELSFYQIGLKQLNLEDNKLKYVPSLQHLTNIEILTFQRNKLKCFPPLHNLDELYYLSLSFNKLKQIPKILTTSKFIYFFILFNELEQIHENLATIPNVYSCHNKFPRWLNYTKLI